MANTSLNRSIKMTPKAALSLDKAGRAKLRANVLGSQKQGNRAAKPPHKIHTAVRIKINKSVLGKSTTPSWSSKIYKIEQIYPPAAVQWSSPAKLTESTRRRTGLAL